MLRRQHVPTLRRRTFGIRRACREPAARRLRDALFHADRIAKARSMSRSVTSTTCRRCLRMRDVSSPGCDPMPSQSVAAQRQLHAAIAHFSKGRDRARPIRRCGERRAAIPMPHQPAPRSGRMNLQIGHRPSISSASPLERKMTSGRRTDDKTYHSARPARTPWHAHRRTHTWGDARAVPSVWMT